MKAFTLYFLKSKDYEFFHHIVGPETDQRCNESHQNVLAKFGLLKAHFSIPIFDICRFKEACFATISNASNRELPICIKVYAVRERVNAVELGSISASCFALVHGRFDFL